MSHLPGRRQTRILRKLTLTLWTLVSAKPILVGTPGWQIAFTNKLSATMMGAATVLLANVIRNDIVGD